MIIYDADKLEVDGHTHTQTDTHTDRKTQATTIPEGQNWPRVIRKLSCYVIRAPAVGNSAVDSPGDVWWTIPRNNDQHRPLL